MANRTTERPIWIKRALLVALAVGGGLVAACGRVDPDTTEAATIKQGLCYVFVECNGSDCWVDCLGSETCEGIDQVGVGCDGIWEFCPSQCPDECEPSRCGSRICGTWPSGCPGVPPIDCGTCPGTLQCLANGLVCGCPSGYRQCGDECIPDQYQCPSPNP